MFRQKGGNFPKPRNNAPAKILNSQITQINKQIKIP